MKQKIITSISLDPNLHKAIKLKRLNLSKLVNDLLWAYLRGDENTDFNFEIKRKERNIAELEQEIKNLQEKLDLSKAELTNLKEMKQQGENRKAKIENQLQKSIKILKTTKDEGDLELFEERLRVHAIELLKMPVEELRELVEKEGT